MNPAQYLYSALDVPLDAAKRIIDQTHDLGIGYKVGLKHISAGTAIPLVRHARSSGARVFYDGKFHDISNTIADAISEILGLGVTMFNLHASASMAAKKKAYELCGSAIVLAVTLLTDISEEECLRTYRATPKEVVVDLATQCVEANLPGIVCSSQELETLNEHESLTHLIRVVPAIRPAGSDIGDQVRVGTPTFAIKHNAHHLVVGRPICDDPNPRDATRRILNEIASALSQR